MAKIIHIAATIVTDPERTRFLVQRKDETYRYPLALALFGGEVEPGEVADEAAARELVEELGADSAQQILSGGLHFVAGFSIGIVFMLFEAVVSPGTLDVIAERPVFEGKRAEILARDDLLVHPDWMPQLAVVIRHYVSQRIPRPTEDPRS